MARKRALIPEGIAGDQGHQQTPKTDENGEDNVFCKLLSLDTRLTQRLAVCANDDSPLSDLRPVMKLLEVSCHEVVWLTGCLIALFMSHEQHIRARLVNLYAALLLDVAVVVMLKVTVRRERPAHNVMDTLLNPSPSIDRFSFPSGHTTRAVTVACFTLDHFPGGPTWSTSIWVWTACVSTSRVLLGRHHTLDVVCGVAIGLLQYQMLVHFLWLPPDMFETILGYLRGIVPW